MRILIIEFILIGIIGAVFYRLAWAFTSKHSVSWAVVLIIMAAMYFFVPGNIDDFLIQEYGGISMASLHPFLIMMLRSAELIVGACLAAIIVIRREKKGLGKEPPFKDFP